MGIFIMEDDSAVKSDYHYPQGILNMLACSTVQVPVK